MRKGFDVPRRPLTRSRRREKRRGWFHPALERPSDVGYDPAVTKLELTVAAEIDRYLRTGETDPYCAAWPGNLLERERRARLDLRGGLIREVGRLAEGRSHRSLLEADTV